MTDINILSPDFKRPEINNEDANILSDDFKNNNKKKLSLKELFSQQSRDALKNALAQTAGHAFKPFGNRLEQFGQDVGESVLPAVEQVPTGINEGFRSGLSALIGGDYEKSAAPEETGASFGRGFGELIGQGVPAAAAGALASPALAAAGAPALIASLGGTGIGFGATTQGDILDRLISGGEAAAFHGAGTAIKSVANNGLPLTKVKEGAKRLKNIFQTGKFKKNEGSLSAQLDENALTREAQTAEEQALKNKLEQNPTIVSSSPNTLDRNANKIEQDVNKIASDLNESPEMQASQMPQRPIMMPESNENTFKQSIEALENKANEKATAEEIHQEAKEAHALKEEETKNILGEGDTHRTNVAKKLNPILEKRQAAIGKEYTGFLNKLKTKNIQLPKSKEAAAALEDAKNQILSNDDITPELKALTNDLGATATANNIPAHDFVQAYRSLKQMAQKVRHSAYGQSPQEFDRLKAVADKMNLDVNKMKTIIDNNLGTDTVEKLNKINKLYATEIAPLFENDFFRAIQGKSKAPTNMIEALTNEPYVKSTNPNKITGTKILNDIIKNDPELLHGVIAETIAANPEKLLKPNELLSSYIEHSAPIKEVKADLIASKQKVIDAELNLKDATKAHKSQTKLHDLEIKKNNAIKEQTKLAENETIRRKEVADNFDKIKSSNEHIKTLRSHAEKLRDHADRQKISLKEKIKLESEHKKAVDALKKVETDRDRLIIAAVSAVGGIAGVKVFK